MAIMNTEVFGYHLDRDINDMFWDGHESYKTEYNKIAKVMTAPAGGHYTEAEMSGIGHLRYTPEGEGLTFDIPVEGNKKTIYYKAYMLGIQITRAMVKDDLFGHFKNAGKMLGKSAAYKPDVVFWDLFNNAFTSETAWDGNPIFHTAHKALYSNRTIANEPATASQLSETSLQAGFEYFYQLEDAQDMPIVMQPKYLIVPIQERWTALQLYKNPRIVGSADNDLSTVMPGNGMVEGWSPFISRWITSSTSWFLLSDEHDFRLFWKEQTELDSMDDFYTKNALFSAYNRFAAFCMDYLGAYGNPGA